VLNPGTLIARLVDQGDVTASRPTVFNAKFDEWDEALKQESEKLIGLRLNNRFENVYNVWFNL
jgi:hypothetical protein